MVSKDEIEVIAETHGMILCETSAKTGEGISDLFF
jgi:hypothetical protein